MLGRDVSIHKIMPNASEDDLQDRFAHLGEVEYNQFMSSRIRYGGGEVVTSQYFTKTSEWGAFGRDRTFTAPDGKVYKWKMGRRVPELVMDVDGKETRVAVYHRRRLGVVTDARPASLEIFPEGEHMLDLIVVTFVYIEKLRKDRENQAKKKIMKPYSRHGGP